MSQSLGVLRHEIMYTSDDPPSGIENVAANGQRITEVLFNKSIKVTRKWDQKKDFRTDLDETFRINFEHLCVLEKSIAVSNIGMIGEKWACSFSI